VLAGVPCVLAAWHGVLGGAPRVLAAKGGVLGGAPRVLAAWCAVLEGKHTKIPRPPSVLSVPVSKKTSLRPSSPRCGVPMIGTTVTAAAWGPESPAAHRR